MNKKLWMLLILIALLTHGILYCAFAGEQSSDNSVTRIDQVKKEDIIQNVALKIAPHKEVALDSSIILEINNAEYDIENIDYNRYQYSSGFLTYYQVMEQIQKNSGNNNEKYSEAVENALKEATGGVTEELPYYIQYIDEHHLQIYLAPITQNAIDNNIVSNDKPYYYIPIVAVTDSDNESEVTVNIYSNGSSVSDSDNLIIAQYPNYNSYTITAVNSISKGQDEISIDTIEVQEAVKNTFEAGHVIVHLNSGFEINTERSDIKIRAGKNLDPMVIEPTIDESKKYFVFDMPAIWTLTTRASSFYIDGIVVDAVDKNNDWGDINIFIKGSNANISRQIIKVAERIDPNAPTTSEISTEITTEATTETTTKQTSGSIASVLRTEKGAYDINISKIYIREAAENTFKNGEVKVELDDGFQFLNCDPVVTAGINLPEYNIKIKNINDSFFTFDIPQEWTVSDKICSFNIEGLTVIPKDEEKNWGDINITISGKEAGITQQTIKVAERIKKGIITTIEDVYSFMEEYEYEMEIPVIKIKQTIPNSLNTGKVSVKLNDGFIFQKYDVSPYAGEISVRERYWYEDYDVVLDEDQKGFSFVIPSSAAFETTDEDIIIISNLTIVPEDPETCYGDILLTISGDYAGISKETIKIGERISSKKPQIIVDGPSNYIFGDVNTDGKVAADDSTIILQKALVSTFKMPVENDTENWLYYADVTGNGKIEADDATTVLQKALLSTFKMPAEKDK